MVWQVIFALVVTISALLIAAILFVSVIYHRYRVCKFAKQAYLAGPRHINHPACKCKCCIWERVDKDPA